MRNILTIRKGLRVQRMHTIPHITPYDNGFHSANAALIAHELCMENSVPSNDAIMYMLLHDVAEGYVGDSPANVKKDNPEIKELLDVIEDKWCYDNNISLPDLNDKEKKICKVSDLSELGMYCLEELQLGNKNVTVVLVNVVNYLKDYTDIKGTQKFIDYFISRGEL